MLLVDLFYHSFTEDEKHLVEQIKENVDNTFDKLCNLQYDLDHFTPLKKLTIVKNFTKKTYPFLNNRFKVVFSKVKQQSKTGGIFIRSYYNVTLVDILSNYLTIKSVIPSINGEYNYKKFEFNETALSCILYHIVGMIMASTGRLLGCQLYAAYLMGVIEFFHVNDIDWSYTKNFIAHYVQNTNYEDLEPYIRDLKNCKKLCDEKRTAVKKGKPHTRKIRVSEKAVLKLLEAGLSQTEIKDQLSIKYGCSPKTVQRAMKSYGLTRSYTK
ncbi:MAG: hypothetical protein J1E16_00390 [Muribaculaceae bacterium]|nr:hypothetical protein [Muribaculaceae bacterium]